MDFLVCGLTLLFLVDYTQGVVITNLHVPFSASHEASLDCKYDLEGEQLYDVKWYKDGEHFFRCQPDGEVNEFPLEGIKIYPTKFAPMGSCPLVLYGLNFKSGGEYRCEVTTEGPLFKSVTKSAKMKILQLSRRVQESSTDKPKESSNNLVSSSSLHYGRSAITIYVIIFIIIIRNIIVSAY